MSGKPTNTPAAATLSDDGTDPLSPFDLEDASGAAWASDAAPARRIRRVTSPRAILFLATIVKFAITLTGTTIMLPMFRVLEDIFCRRHLQDTSPGFIEEKRCKVAEVQQELAYLMGWLMVVGGLVGVVIALPYGALADRIGRKPVLIWSYFGLAFGCAIMPFAMPYLRNVNPYWMLVGATFSAFGGGVPVAFNMLYAIAADVADEKNRGASFLMLMVGATTGGILGPLISGALMEAFDPWVPIYVVSAISPFVLASMFLLPETLARKASDTNEPSQSLAETVRSQTAESLSQLRAATSLLRTRSVVLILATFLAHNPVTTAHSTMLVQYVSHQFGWDMAQTGFLLSPLGVLNVIVLAAALPKVADILTSSAHRFKFSAFRKDLVLARFSLAFVATACIIEGLSRSILPFIFGLFVGSLGAAASPLSRALLTHYIDPELTSRLMALISIVEITGSFLGGPIIAVFFQIGQEKGGTLTGLPYLYVGILAAGALFCLVYIRAPRKLAEEEEGGVDLPEPYVDERRRRESTYSDEPDAPLL